jgi:hypothetical protein
MEKTYQLDQKELGQLQGLDQERTQALAMIGALSLDMETARKNLEAAAERQRQFIRSALEKREVTRYNNAQVRNGSIAVDLPDASQGDGGFQADKPNGSAALNANN